MKEHLAQSYETYSMLKSAEMKYALQMNIKTLNTLNILPANRTKYEIYPAINIKMPTTTES